MPIVEKRSVFSGIPVSEAMRRQVISLPRSADLGQAIRLMIRCKANSVLLTDQSVPCGVVSKTDLIIAYHHGVHPEAEARKIMSTPVHSVSDRALLSTAIQEMLTRDVQRLFVHGDPSDPHDISGVLALSDAARFRSGSCRACTAGRLLMP